VSGARLSSQVLVSSLLRLAEGAGGFGAVLAKGDATAGAIMVILAERGIRAAVLERLLQPDGSYAWQDSGRAGADEDDFRALLERRRRNDPDLWLIELDVADAERFAAEMNAAG
jgi:hypothetical protein